MEIVKDLKLDEERALYGLHNIEVVNCIFEGPADGESALKECSNVIVRDSSFMLRYPFWHVTNSEIINCKMSETCRAALWYDKNIKLKDCVLGGIKALRECSDVTLTGCEAVSPEFGWFCNNIELKDTSVTAEYPFLKSKNMKMDNLNLKGKYSFQYVEDTVIKNSYLDTKDAFWHSKNITVIDSVVKGEYLAWYSENLKLIRCKIIGTQPLCYAKGLVMEDCEMADCDLSFEYSEVEATVNGEITSVKNPKSGNITADTIGEIIIDENQAEGADCIIKQRKENTALA